MPTWLKMTEHHPIAKEADHLPSHALGAENDPGSLDATLRWQIIWPRVVATAWADPAFKAKLLEDASAAIEERFHYQLMPDLKLTVKEDPSCTQFDPSKIGGAGSAEASDPWHGLPGIDVTMYLPAPPPVEMQAVAITAYEDTGRTYPFTCC